MSKKNGDIQPTDGASPRKRASDRIRKIGEREEIIDHKLTQIQIEDMRSEVLTLLDEEEKIEARKDEAGKVFSSQLKTNRLQINELRRIVSAGRRRETIVVEEFLTHGNEVVRIRQDTGEQVGFRNATQKELQEELPLDGATQADQAPEDGFEDGDFGGDSA